ncbi:hypothetical protein RHSIM_Rhsim04G0062400 [Rhododendron simsii]|uniref:Uncharacterized protein n=1 Tax=Rhododendron simsii TaxID=118357 RepID=A0A834H0H4_RHOSS|nr:hypothetical protein RHSIM_Rhsim04G0062400 [Rhododendron simsii]
MGMCWEAQRTGYLIGRSCWDSKSTPIKIEEIAIDETRAVSLTESRDAESGIEVGLVLPRAQMNAFGSIFRKGLNSDRLE